MLSASIASGQSQDDPYLWLEDVSGSKALAWVEARNAQSVQELEAKPQFQPIFQHLLEINESQERIPYVERLGAHYYNFWRDGQHVRGIWRRTTLAEYRKAQPDWETVFDLDAVAAAEKENWVWHGAHCLFPDYRRCLMLLSRGGADAVVVREFDVTTKEFVRDGYTLPEAKSDIAWRGPDSVLVATDFGPGSLTRSGYPRVVKQWSRGTPLASAKMVFEVSTDDVGVGMAVVNEKDPQFRQHELITREIAFFRSETLLREGDSWVRLDLPLDARASVAQDQLIVQLRSDWAVAGRTWPAGALLITELEAFRKGERTFTLLFQPEARISLAGYTVLQHAILVNELDNVRSCLYEWTRVAGKWTRRAVTVSGFGTLTASAVERREGDEYFLTLTDFLTPSSLYLARAGSDARELLKHLPAYFDASPLAVTQHEATSKDGTPIPYFVVMNRDAKQDGSLPTLLYGYGGFEIAMQPAYSERVGPAWLARGGAYVLANIRGGGEFGPQWHQAALKENRQRAYDDFIAVGEDLVARKITSPRHLGIMGGSNGGLLVGAVMVQRPELFRAVVCQVPLLDMRRYHKLLAGASWMAEYGDPDSPGDWDYIGKYSPYQNVRKDVKYPRVLFTTSTRDDRVHPAHARKMVARMREQGHDVLYYENIEGGHGLAANARQQATMSALAYTFLLNELQ